MLTLPPSVRIFIALEPTDMRKQFDGLYAKACEVTDIDPFSGHLEDRQDDGTRGG